MKKKFFTILILLIYSTITFAHADGQDFMRSIGKIYVVFAVIIAIFAGLIGLMIWLERRIATIEKQIYHS